MWSMKYANAKLQCTVNAQPPAPDCVAKAGTEYEQDKVQMEIYTYKENGTWFCLTYICDPQKLDEQQPVKAVTALLPMPASATTEHDCPFPNTARLREYRASMT